MVLFPCELKIFESKLKQETNNDIQLLDLIELKTAVAFLSETKQVSLI